MTTSVRFYLPHDHLKWNFIALKMKISSIRKRIVGTEVDNGVTCARQSVITHVLLHKKLCQKPLTAVY